MQKQKIESKIESLLSRIHTRNQLINTTMYHNPRQIHKHAHYHRDSRQRTQPIKSQQNIPHNFMSFLVFSMSYSRLAVLKMNSCSGFNMSLTFRFNDSKSSCLCRIEWQSGQSKITCVSSSSSLQNEQTLFSRGMCGRLYLCVSILRVWFDSLQRVIILL